MRRKAKATHRTSMTENPGGGGRGAMRRAHQPAVMGEMTKAQMAARIAELERCIREMHRSIPGGQFVGCQEAADELRAIALKYNVRMGDESCG